MGAMRLAFMAVWGGEVRRPYLRGKLLDGALVLGSRPADPDRIRADDRRPGCDGDEHEDRDELGFGERATGGIGALAQLGASLALGFAAFALLYRVVPPVPVRSWTCSRRRVRDGRCPSRGRGLLRLPRSIRQLRRHLRAARSGARIPAARLGHGRDPARRRVRCRRLASGGAAGPGRGGGTADRPPGASCQRARRPGSGLIGVRCRTFPREAEPTTEVKRMLARLHTLDATPEQYEAGLRIVRTTCSPGRARAAASAARSGSSTATPARRCC